MDYWNCSLNFNQFFYSFYFFLKCDIHVDLTLDQFPIEWWVKHNFTTIINNVTAFQKAYPLKNQWKKLTQLTEAESEQCGFPIWCPVSAIHTDWNVPDSLVIDTCFWLVNRNTDWTVANTLAIHRRLSLVNRASDTHTHTHEAIRLSWHLINNVQLVRSVLF